MFSSSGFQVISLTRTAPARLIMILPPRFSQADQLPALFTREEEVKCDPPDPVEHFNHGAPPGGRVGDRTLKRCSSQCLGSILISKSVWGSLAITSRLKSWWSRAAMSLF